jgi:hypothetical protein
MTNGSQERHSRPVTKPPAPPIREIKIEEEELDEPKKRQTDEQKRLSSNQHDAEAATHRAHEAVAREKQERLYQQRQEEEPRPLSANSYHSSQSQNTTVVHVDDARSDTHVPDLEYEAAPPPLPPHKPPVEMTLTYVTDDGLVEPQPTSHMIKDEVSPVPEPDRGIHDIFAH